MNRFKIFVWILSILTCFSSKPLFSAGMDGGGDPIEEARNMYKRDTKMAFSIIETEIKKAKRYNDHLKTAECYILLARINDYLNDEVGLRTNLANAQTTLKQEKKCQKCKHEIEAEINLVRGYLSIKQESYPRALNFFKQAQEADNKSIKYPAKEGEADVLIIVKQQNEALKIYEDLIQKYINSYDDESKARLASKKAAVLANLGQIDDAVNTYAEANYSNAKIRENTSTNKYIEKANDAIINSTRSKDLDPVDVSKQTIESMESKKVPVPVVLKQKINLAKVLVEEKKFDEAEKIIQELLASKQLNKSDLNKVYELRSTISLDKKDYKSAYDYLNKKERSTKTAEKELSKKKIDIVRGQAKLEKELTDIDLERKDSQIDEIQNTFLFFLIGTLCLVTLAASIFSFVLWKNVKAKNKANQKLELKSLRTQMNPHFIFNSMNSINNFISQNDERAANKFIADFSKLIRKIMNFSQKEFISIEEEIELLDIYLRLEQSRFRDKFDFNFDKDPALSDLQLEIPPMLIQPFLENAIWHGLRYKDQKGFLKLSIKKSEQGLYVEIEDNGIGRKKSMELKTKNQKQYKSTGMSNIKKRVDLINELYNLDYKYEISDADSNESGDVGTLIKFYLNGTPKKDKA